MCFYLSAKYYFVREATVFTEVGGFYWIVLALDIVNSGREKQGSISM